MPPSAQDPASAQNPASAQGPTSAQDHAGALIDLLQSFSIEVDRFVGTFADAHDLHRTDLHAIAHIWRSSRLGEPMTPSALATQLSLSPPATTALLDRLERAGYVVRSQDTADRRRILLHGQPSAQVVAQAFFRPLGQSLRRVMAEYPAEELLAFRGFVESILTATAAVADAAQTGPRVTAPRGAARPTRPRPPEPPGATSADSA